MLDQSFGWLRRKYEWASKREYEVRRINQYDIQAAVVDSLSLVIGSLFGKKDHDSSLLKPYEEAIGATKHKLSDDALNEGIDTTMWWKGSKRNEDNN